MTNKTPKAIFLDRDGTIIRDKNYLSRVEDIEYFPDTLPAIRLMIEKGYRLYIITNQSGVGRGYFGIEAVEKIHQAMDEDMQGVELPPFSGWGVCPHAPDQNCLCRKPSPQLILDFLKKDNLDPHLCWMVGDKNIDAACGRNAGIQSAIIREKSHAESYPFFESLLEFAESLP